jgi:6-phosphogluconolactonase
MTPVKVMRRMNRRQHARLRCSEFPGTLFVVPDQSGISRRSFLRTSSTFAAVTAAMRMAPAWAQSNSGMLIAYVGCYTDHGEGIYLFRVNPATGELTPIKVVKGISNPSWLALHPTRPLLYAANEETHGGVTALAIRPDGDLSVLGRVDSLGKDPAHISVHPSGRYLLVSNYSSGNVAVLSIQADGSLGAATDQHDDASACTPACAAGPSHPVKGPVGNFPENGHDAPHAHMIESDPSGKFVFVNDLGLDRTIVWQFDVEKGTLSNPHSAQSSAGAGSRHFVLHPNGKWFYSLNEQASSLSFMTFDAATGTLSPVLETSTLPESFTGTSAASELLLSRDARFLYAGNRLHDTIAIFTVGKDGTPTLLGEESTRGDHPRHFNFDPTGEFFYVCNQKSDTLSSYRVDRKTGKLAFSDRYTPVGSPSCIVFRRFA